jgi:hypothetical protein
MDRKFLNEVLSSIEDESTKKQIVDKIMDENGKQIEKHKTEVETLKNDLKVKSNLIDELNSKIKENESVDIEAIKQEEFEKGKAEGSKEVETFKKSNALDKMLQTSKAKDVKLLKKLIDNEKIEYNLDENGEYSIKGLDEQIKNIQETHSYLFDIEENNNTPSINLGGNHNAKAPTNEPTDLSSALHQKYDKK